MITLSIRIQERDSSAALLHNGVLNSLVSEGAIAASESETCSPKNAIDFCMKEAGVQPGDIDHLIIANKPLQQFDATNIKALYHWPKSLNSFRNGLVHNWHIYRIINRQLLKYISPKEIFYCQPHDCMAAAATIESPRTDQYLWVIENFKDSIVTERIFLWEKGKLKVLDEVGFHESIFGTDNNPSMEALRVAIVRRTQSLLSGNHHVKLSIVTTNSVLAKSINHLQLQEPFLVSVVCLSSNAICVGGAILARSITLPDSAIKFGKKREHNPTKITEVREYLHRNNIPFQESHNIAKVVQEKLDRDQLIALWEREAIWWEKTSAKQAVLSLQMRNTGGEESNEDFGIANTLRETLGLNELRAYPLIDKNCNTPLEHPDAFRLFLQQKFDTLILMNRFVIDRNDLDYLR